MKTPRQNAQCVPSPSKLIPLPHARRPTKFYEHALYGPVLVWSKPSHTDTIASPVSLRCLSLYTPACRVWKGDIISCERRKFEWKVSQHRKLLRRQQQQPRDFRLQAPVAKHRPRQEQTQKWVRLLPLPPLSRLLPQAPHLNAPNGLKVDTLGRAG